MILIGDVREKLKELPDQSVHCVVTSPPYWGLRDYGTALWDGGDPECDHMSDKRGSRFATPVSKKQGSNTGSGTASRRDCDCGAMRIDNQIGMEDTPEQFVANIVEVFREVWRVMRDDGTLWLNLGDSYAGSGKGPAGNLGATHNERWLEHKHSAIVPNGLKPKDLVGIPWRVAFALQTEGWYLRQDIIWHKPNPMPESVTDRCTKSHEYIFLLSKSRQYYFDNEAIKEPNADPKRTNYTPGKRAYAEGNTLQTPGKRTRRNDGFEAYANGKIPTGRNKRDVWTVTTRPFKGAHFATFPPQLIEPCILAGCPEGGTVLDPFFGAGTTGLVAQQHGRNWIGCELNPVYAEMAAKRIKDAEPQPKLFN